MQRRNRNGLFSEWKNGPGASGRGCPWASPGCPALCRELGPVYEPGQAGSANAETLEESLGPFPTQASGTAGQAGTGAATARTVTPPAPPPASLASGNPAPHPGERGEALPAAAEPFKPTASCRGQWEGPIRPAPPGARSPRTPLKPPRWRRGWAGSRSRAPARRRPCPQPPPLRRGGAGRGCTLTPVPLSHTTTLRPWLSMGAPPLAALRRLSHGTPAPAQ